MFQEIQGLSDDTVSRPGVDIDCIFDVAIRRDQGFHVSGLAGNNIAFVIADIYTVATIDSQVLGSDLQGQGVGFTLRQRIAADYGTATRGQMELFE
jgi:hypothetical protein